MVLPPLLDCWRNHDGEFEVLTMGKPYRWYNATYTLFAVSILLTAVFYKFSITIEELDDLFLMDHTKAQLED